MTTPYILPFDVEAVTLAIAGGKALNLAKLAQAGFPMAPGFIVTTVAYRDFVATNDLQAWILDTVAGVQPDDPAALAAAAQSIRARFAALPVPDTLTHPFLTAYHALPISNPQSPISNIQSPLPVAVRSSATAEDLPEASFAGQQDTFLNVVGDDALLAAVVNCWSSLWTARAIAYRSRNSIPHDDVALAVIVQAMVQSESSGVLFTANPLTGKRDEVVIDATLGLGEALVSGQVEPDQYVVDATAGRIVSKTLGAKAIAIRSQAGGGTVTVEADASQQQALPDAAIVELARLGQQVEERLYDGQPQDIEWAWAGGRLTLLQARAITSLYPLPAGMPPEPLQVMFSVNHVQGMLDPFTPLGQDALKLALLALVRLFGRRFDLETQREAQVAGERIYANFTPALRHPLARKIARGFLGSIEPGTQQALDTLLDDPRLAPTGSRPSLKALCQMVRVVLPIVRGVVLALRHPDARRDAVQREVEALLIDMQRRSRRATSLAQRLALWEDFYDLIPNVLAPQVFPLLAAGMASFFQLRRLISSLPGDDRQALEVTRGLPHNVTTEMDLALWTVAQVIKADPQSSARLAEADAVTLASDYLAGRLPLAAQAATAGFLHRYGMRGLAEIDLGRPRWRDNPTPIMQVLQSYLQIDDPALAPDAVFRQGAIAAEAAIEQLVQDIGNPVQAWLVRFFSSRMRALAGLREYPKFAIIRLMGIVRESLLQSGRDLVEAGVLAQPDDLFFLHFRELEALAAGESRDWRALVAGRRRTYEREKLRRQVPRLLLSDGRAFYAGIDSGATEGDGVITGSPVSPGVVEGLVHVVFDPHETQLAPGEILVCPGTDPAWTPLFLAAGGLVMEVGGLMTHGSVVAREYGIPAVVGVHEATKRLKTGQRVRVDGSAGRIVVVDKSH